MPYFQNVSDQEFFTEMLFDTRLAVRLPANANRSTRMVAWNPEPYDLSQATRFAICCKTSDYAMGYVRIEVALASNSAATAQGVADQLNADPTFASFFAASTIQMGGAGHLLIAAVSPAMGFRAYVPNTVNRGFPEQSAEWVLRFNKKAAVAQLSQYYRRHTIGYYVPNDSFAYGTQMLLEVVQPDEDFVISEAGLDTAAMTEAQLLKGESGKFLTSKVVTDASNGNRPLSAIEFESGSIVGDLAKKTTYVYDAGNTSVYPNRVYEEPYTLTAADLVQPPLVLVGDLTFGFGGSALASHS